MVLVLVRGGVWVGRGGGDGGERCCLWLIMSPMTSQSTSLVIVYSTVYSGTDKRKHQSSASLAFVWWPVNSLHKGPITRKMLPFDYVVMSVIIIIKSHVSTFLIAVVFFRGLVQCDRTIFCLSVHLLLSRESWVFVSPTTVQSMGPTLAK